MTAPPPVQETPAPAGRASRFRVFAAALCVMAGLLAVVAMLGVALAPSHPMALPGWLALFLIGAAALGSILNPRKAQS